VKISRSRSIARLRAVVMIHRRGHRRSGVPCRARGGLNANFARYGFTEIGVQKFEELVLEGLR